MSYNLPLSVATQKALTNALQEWIVGVSNLKSDMVRPRWQVQPPPRPQLQESWIAFGLTDIQQDASPFQNESPAGTAPATVEWTEKLLLLLSFYGPNASIDAATFRNTAYVEVNRYPLSRLNIRLQGFGNVVTLNELVNELWFPRADMPMTLHRGTVQTYTQTQATKVNVSISSTLGSVPQAGVTYNGKP